MSSSLEIRVPRETVNDDFVTIEGWSVSAGEKVRAGQIVVTVETSKALLEIEAEGEGYVEILCTDGAEVEVGALIGRISSQPGGYATPAAEAPAPGAPAAEGSVISGKARVLIEEHGLDPEAFAGRGLVREADVIAHLEAQVERREALGRSAAVPAIARERLGLWGDARVSARERGTGVLRLGLDYFFRNWLLGHVVRFAPRGLDLLVHRLRGVKMGRDCFIDPTAIVETAYPENVTLGNDVRITAGVVIMTHIKAPHYLRDTGIMPLVLKPVVLEDHCFIGINAVIVPGVTVGRAATVASGAVVVSNVPPYTMVAGNPARVIKRFPRPAAVED
jgi:acetyltransferase-like isoleucine patch superfamily enzyme